MAIHKFIHAISNGTEIAVFGDGTQTRDFTFIGDVIAANILAADTDLVGEVFNIGGGSRISVIELIEKIEALTGKKAKLNYKGKQKGDVRDTWADVSKAEEMLNWKSQIDINEGLRLSVAWFI